jgi:hypothetical protein
MTDVFVGPGARLFRAQGQERLGSIQRLDARFLVHTQYQRILRRVQIQPDDIQQLGFEIGVGAEIKGPNSMRLQLGGYQHRCVEDSAGDRW